MKTRYWIQLAVLIAAMCLASVALYRAYALGAEVDAIVLACALVYLAWATIRVARAAHADWLCYALTGQRMPPRKPK